MTLLRSAYMWTFVCKKEKLRLYTYLPILFRTLFKARFSVERLGSHLFYTLISENPGLEKLRSISNLRKISGLTHLDFFSVCSLDFFFRFMV